VFARPKNRATSRSRVDATMKTTVLVRCHYGRPECTVRPAHRCLVNHKAAEVVHLEIIGYGDERITNYRTPWCASRGGVYCVAGFLRAVGFNRHTISLACAGGPGGGRAVGEAGLEKTIEQAARGVV